MPCDAMIKMISNQKMLDMGILSPLLFLFNKISDKKWSYTSDFWWAPSLGRAAFPVRAVAGGNGFAWAFLLAGRCKGKAGMPFFPRLQRANRWSGGIAGSPVGCPAEASDD